MSDKQGMSSIPGLAGSCASRVADANWQSNRDALKRTQPASADSLPGGAPGDVEWVYGRDGSLTGRRDGKWVAGCSLPRRAARVMLKSMDISSRVGCFVNPPHAGHVREALDHQRPDQAIVVVVPDEESLRVMLGCEDFAGDIAAHRLWLAGGEGWEEQFAAIFRDNEGLPVPGHFLRIPAIDEERTSQVMAAAQKLIGVEAQRRTTSLAATQHVARDFMPTEICVVAPSMFRLWEDAGAVLGDVTRGDGVVLLDTDDPASASPLALAKVSRQCAAVVTANVGRADLPGVVPTDVRWITWVTTGRVPGYVSAAPGDAVLLANEAWREATARVGWPAERVGVAGWPVTQLGAAGSRLTVIANTSELEPPVAVQEMSSHRLLWEAIASELLADPFALEESLERYLDERVRRMELSSEGFDRRSFLQRLILPAYQQGIVRALMAEGLPVRVYGEGWEKVPDFTGIWGGKIASRAELLIAAQEAAALVHVWPGSVGHPIEAMGRSVVRRTGRRRESFMREVKMVMAGKEPEGGGERRAVSLKVVGEKLKS